MFLFSLSFFKKKNTITKIVSNGCINITTLKVMFDEVKMKGSNTHTLIIRQFGFYNPKNI